MVKKIVKKKKTRLEEKYSGSYPFKEIKTIQELIDEVEKVKKEWCVDGNNVPWFRGQRDCSNPPIPSIFREYDKKTGKKYSQESEFNMVTMFRNRAPALGITPEVDRVDKWLFLMQHYRLPTRLLDWTENLFAALYFAVFDLKNKKYSDPGVWMLNSIALNKMSNINCYPNTWAPRKPGTQYFQYIVTKDKNLLSKYPLAIQPTFIESRIFAQKGVFTIHGKLEEDFEKLFKGKEKNLRKFIISRSNAIKMIKVLNTLGVIHSTLYPEFEGLAYEIKERFKE